VHLDEHVVSRKVLAAVGHRRPARARQRVGRRSGADLEIDAPQSCRDL
jgi:hypothetical protein